jgi:glutamine cyclotransferase
VRAALVVAILMTTLTGDEYRPLSAPAPHYGFRVLKIYPHDTSAYTEGLVYRDGTLYEGTGVEGQSRIRELDLQTGKTLREIRLDPRFFGEGITLHSGEIVELTWQSHRGFVYNAATFAPIRTFDYPGEGWGLTDNGTELFMSDGTPGIRCLDPSTLREKRRFIVHDGPHPIGNLNELEFMRGEIYANVWFTDKLVRFSASDGHVTGWVDLENLLPAKERPRSIEGVLNGIAWDSSGDRLFVTGKMWPKLFEIGLVPHENRQQ